MKFPNVAVLGLGLIGSSVARAVRACLPEMQITAMDADEETLRIAHGMQLADVYTTDAAKAVADADLVVLAVPVMAFAQIAKAITPHLKPGAVVTDVGSVKRLMLSLFPESVAVVPAHPIAGSEKSGVSAGSATLFAGRQVILTPADPEAPAVRAVAEFWEALRAKVQYMPADLHDRVYACVSHLPQYLAFHVKPLYEAAHASREGDETLRRFMRLTGSNDDLWSGIFKTNSDNINSWLKTYLQVLHQIRSELLEGASTTQEPVDMPLVYGALFPRIAASCLVHVAHVAGRELNVPLQAFAGTGFSDFTAPASAPPELHMERISGQAQAVARVVDDFAALLERRRYIAS